MLSLSDSTPKTVLCSTFFQSFVILDCCTKFGFSPCRLSCIISWVLLCHCMWVMCSNVLNMQLQNVNKPLLLAKALVMPSCIREKGKKCWWQCHYNAKNTNKRELSYDCDGATPLSHSRHKDKHTHSHSFRCHGTTPPHYVSEDKHTHSFYFCSCIQYSQHWKVFSKPVLQTTPLLNSLSYHIHAGNYYSVHLFFTSSVTLKIISSYWNDFIWQVSSELFMAACLPACGRQAVPLGHSGISGLLCRYW